jgi:hypothetical protein
VIHVFNIRGNTRRREHRLPTGGRRVDTEAEQGGTRTTASSRALG